MVLSIKPLFNIPLPEAYYHLSFTSDLTIGTLRLSPSATPVLIAPLCTDAA